MEVQVDYKGEERGGKQTLQRRKSVITLEKWSALKFLRMLSKAWHHRRTDLSVRGGNQNFKKTKVEWRKCSDCTSI